MSYVIVEYWCNHHGGWERVRIPISQSNRFKSEYLEPVVIKGSKGIFLKAVRVGHLITKQEIEKFLKTHFEGLGASHVEINYVEGY